MPALGLSNKAVYQDKEEDRDVTPSGNEQYPESAFTPIELNSNMYSLLVIVVLHTHKFIYALIESLCTAVSLMTS